jgi:hypothetical protein
MTHKQKMQLATVRIKHLEAVAKAVKLGQPFSFLEVTR